MFVRALDEQARRHGLDAELVVVDWNPPPDRPRLAEVLPSAKGPLDVRYCIVPPEIHARFANSERIPFFQWEAKNVGIRRAWGRFILVTNADILFGDPLMARLAQGGLDPGKMYRANRCDVALPFDFRAPLDAQLEYCRTHSGRRYGLLPVDYGKRLLPLRRVKRRLVSLFGSLVNVESQRHVDTEASGDFTLMAKEAWLAIGGYAELGLHAHIDSLACHTAVACGYQQVVLPPDCCVYHVDHERSWMSMGLVERIRHSAVRPSLDWLHYCEAVEWLRANRRPLPVNDASWGCRDHDIPCVALQPHASI